MSDSEVEDGQTEITSVRTVYTLDQFVAGITDENRHDEIVWGRPVGGEVW